MRKKQIDGSVGQCIARLRIALGLSQKQIATRVGITVRQLRYYERGHSAVSTERLIQLARALGCKPAELLPGFTSREPRAAPARDQDR